MATFGQNNGRSGIAVVPVAAYITMAHVNMLHRFHVLHANDFPDGPALNHFAEFFKIRRIPQHMTNGHDPPRFFGQGENIAAFFSEGEIGFSSKTSYPALSAAMQGP